MPRGPVAAVVWPSVLLSALLTASSRASTIAPFVMPITYFDGFGPNECRKKLEKAEDAVSGYIYSHEPFNEPYGAGKNCFMTLRAPRGRRIRLTVLDFFVSGQPELDCDKDSLHVFDQEGPVRDSQEGPGPLIGTFCGRLKNGTILVESTFNALTLWWHTDADLPSNHSSRGFRLFWTVYRSKPTRGRCGPMDAACGNGDCISTALACDRLPHCTDGSDLDARVQRRVGCELPQGVWPVRGLPLAALCVAVVVGSVCLCVAVSVCYRAVCRAPTRRSPPLAVVDPYKHEKAFPPTAGRNGVCKEELRTFSV